MQFYAATTEYASFFSPVNAPCFRRSFTVSAASAATLAITTPGFYELFVNGTRITKGRFSPGITNPDHMLTVDRYELLPYLREGENVIGILLGNGMANCIGWQTWNGHIAPWRAAPSVALEAEIRQKEKVLYLTAGDFVTAPSAITFDDMRAGEWYDARLAKDGWNLPEFDDSAWALPLPVKPPRGILRDADIDPILPAGELAPVSVHRGGIGIERQPDEDLPNIPREPDEDGEGYIYNFGVNITGVVRLTVKNARPGQKIVLQYGEILGENPEGGVDTTVRTAESGLDLRGFHNEPLRYNHRDVYICRGGEEEVWEPTFTIHGFQYCLVLGAEQAQVSLTAVILHSALRKRAEFTCSDDTANRIFEATVRSDLGNFCHYPTDCPHREKNFWTGDAMISAEQFVELLSCERNLTDWLRSFAPAMRADGGLPGIIPSADWGYGWGAGWDGALIEIPYRIYCYRGDLTAAREQAATILRSVRYLVSSRDQKGLIRAGQGCDWVQSARRYHDKPTTSHVFSNTVLTMDLCRKAAKLFRAMGMADESAYCENLSTELRASARKYLVNLDTMSAIDRVQTAQAMAIYYGLFEPAEVRQAFDVLLTLIDQNGGSFDCGIYGLRVIFHVLSRFERSDLAFRMITKPEFPSYGYPIVHGATTLWELMSPIECGQSSCNHHFFGDVASWFIQRLAGIRLNPFDENVNEVHIAPAFVNQLDHAAASLEAPAGIIRAAWRRDGEDVLLDVTIPDGMSAELRLESGWQTEEGYTSLPLAETETLRILPVSKPNILRRFAK